MHRASLYRLVPALLLLAAAGCNNDTAGTSGGSCEADLAAGALVITELMPDPKGADDSSFEWFEIHNPGAAEVTLTGLGLELSKLDDSSAKGHQIKDALVIPAGGYITVGKATAETLPEYLDYGYGADLGSMGNTNGKLKLVCGDVTIDEVLYQDLSDGYSRSFGRSPPDAVGNDDLSAWCDGAELYNASEYGSPGAANPECPLPVPACGMCYENGQLRASRSPAPGQLVISEIMPNAKLTDTTFGEWFELSVVAGEFDLNCLQYGANTTKFLADPSNPDLTLEASECIGVRAGDIKLFAEQEGAPGFDFPIDFALVDSPSDSNPNPGIYVAMGGQILDEAHYTSTKDGVAWSLDPDQLDAIANDDPVNWCLATTPFAEGDLGTPGAVNPQCPEPPPPGGTCLDGDTARPIKYAAAGDLLVSEVFTDPMVADSSLGEWIELVTFSDIDLNGLTFGKTLDTPYATVTDAACLPIAAGSVVLIAKTADPAMNGGLPTPDWIHPKISLTNDASTLVVGVEDRETMARTALDAIAWGNTADGKAQQFPIDLIPAAGPIDETINDDPALWCASSQVFGAGDFGTPQADNLACGGQPMGAKCTDPDTMMPRDIKSPALGDLIITEVLPDPDALIKSGGAGEPAGEWFEVFAAADFDLNGLDIGNTFPTPKHTVTSAMCLPVTAGSHVLLARAGEPLAPPNPMDLAGNGGLPTPNYEYGGLSLSNSGAGLYVGVGDVLLDAITFPKPAVGKSTQLSTAAACTGPAPLDPACNDDLASWCAASTPYGLGDSGTPQAANLDCGGGNMDAMCFDVGMNAMRPIVAPQIGDLVINEYMADPSAVTDANGEWFEIAALNAVDLNDLKILNKPNPDMATVTALKPLLVSGDCLRADAGSLVLFAHQTDPAINGGLPPVDHQVATSLTNTGGGLSIAIGDTLLHTVSWALAQKAGKATLLDPDGLLDPLNTVADGPPWCFAADAGTPKAANPQCP